jgi:hypothetical protein
MVHTPTEVMDFMECLESTKVMDQWQGQEEVSQEEEQQQQQQQWWF